MLFDLIGMMGGNKSMSLLSVSMFFKSVIFSLSIVVLLHDVLSWYCVDKLASFSNPGMEICTSHCVSVYVDLFCGFPKFFVVHTQNNIIGTVIRVLWVVCM